jgi:hypothetical protein
MKIKPKTRERDIVIQELNDEILIYDLGLNRAFYLNQSAALVWQACDGRKDVAAIGREISQKLQTPAADEFVWLALNQLKKENLLQNADELPADFGGLSRRQVIKRIGFSSMIALPMISSLVAPSAAHAQSGVCGGSCQCGGLLSTVSVCPPGFAECAQGCNCVIANQQTDCFSVEGVFACNGTCSSQPPPPTCPVSSPGDCACFGNFSLNQTCPGVQCAGGCTTCRVTQACIPQEVGPPACNGVCQ